jgi:hypothetical protein
VDLHRPWWQLTVEDPLVAAAMVDMIMVVVGAVLHVATASPTTGLVMVALATHPDHNAKCALNLVTLPHSVGIVLKRTMFLKRILLLLFPPATTVIGTPTLARLITSPGTLTS